MSSRPSGPPAGTFRCPSVPHAAAALVLIAAFCILVSFSGGGSDAVTATSGSCGPNLQYSMNEQGELTFTGSGEMTSIGSWDDCTTVTVPEGVTSIREFAFWNCDSLTTVTFTGNITSIGSQAFCDCGSLATVTFAGNIGSIGDGAFHGCGKLNNVSVRCDNPLGITAGSTDNGRVAYFASEVKLSHPYSASYTWAEDGKSCTVNNVCANDSNHNTSFAGTVTSSVKTPATCTVAGTTAYSVSGTYDGFDYSDTKEIQDIPALGHAYSAICIKWLENDILKCHNIFPHFAL